MRKEIIKTEEKFKGKILSLKLETMKWDGEIVTREIVDFPNTVAILPLIDGKTIMGIELL